MFQVLLGKLEIRVLLGILDRQDPLVQQDQSASPAILDQPVRDHKELLGPPVRRANQDPLDHKDSKVKRASMVLKAVLVLQVKPAHLEVLDQRDSQASRVRVEQRGLLGHKEPLEVVVCARTLFDELNGFS
jgi:hypothetical protein